MDQLGKSILVVDDEDALRDVVCKYLTKAGYDVVDSPSGPDAICKVTQEHFDAVISDVRMPEMSGFDLMYVLEKLCEDTVVILLTAVEDPDGNMAKLSKAAGCYAYLTKPCELHVIKDTLEQAFAERDASKGTSPIPAEKPLPPEVPELTRLNSPSLTKPNTGETSGLSSEIEAVIYDPDQAPAQSEDAPQLELETFSHRFGDLHLNTKPDLKREIENIILKPKTDVRQLSPQQYVTLVQERFLSRGWEDHPSLTDKHGKQVPVLDFRKEGIGLLLGFQTKALVSAIMKLQQAYESESAKIEVGVFIIQTGNFQKLIKNVTGKPWTGASFTEAVRTLKSLQRQIEVPICIMGLDITESNYQHEILLSSYERNVDPVPYKGEVLGVTNPRYNLADMSAPQIKKSVFDFLEKKYKRPIERNVRIRGKDGTIGIDGLIQLSSDVILEIEMSRSQGSPHARAISSIGDDIAKSLREYQRITGRRSVMRFILLGEFAPGFLRDLNWRIENACKEDESIKIDYEMLSFEEVGILTYDKTNQVRL